MSKSSRTCSSEQCSYAKPAKWLKGRTVGRGSHGSIDLALDMSTGGLFVVKSAESESGILCLENEAEILQSLDSPYVVKCLGKDDVSTGGSRKASLFMEYMAGGSLADVMGQFGGRLDETVVRLYTREILRGLEYLHGNGIVHCDVKCKNVLLGSSGEVKLADFGCSRRRTGQRREKGSLRHPIGGSPLWMAPENLKSGSGFGPDFASDIWSLGCTVIEMATGQLPWAGEISDNIVLRIAQGEAKPDFPKHLSQEGLDFLDKCLNRDPRKRWKARELLRHPFVQQKPKDNLKYPSSSSSSSSPASVLDRSVFPESDCSDDEEDEGHEARPTFRIPSSMLSEKNSLEDQQQEDWITVR